MLTPTKAAALRAISSENPAFTNGQVSDRQKELGMEFSGETVRRWFKKEGARKVVRRIKPSLSDSQTKRRIDFTCDQVDEVTGNVLDQINVIHLDESWFFLLKGKEKIRMFRGEDIPGSPRVQRKSHVPKIMIGVANARPDPTHNFDGKIGIWRICIMKTAQRSSKKRKEGDEYEFDCTIDAEWYKDCLLYTSPSPRDKRQSRMPSSA